MKRICAFFVMTTILATVSTKAQIVSYTTLDYSIRIPANGSLTNGSLNAATNTVLEFSGCYMVARGYSFQVTSKKIYRITATFSTTQRFNDYADVFVLENNDPLVGDWSDVSKDIFRSGSGVTQLTVSGVYIATNTRMVKLLIGSYDLVPLSYQIKIEEISVPGYTTLDYSAILSVDNTPVSGTLSEANNALIDPYGRYVTGKGYAFPTRAGKVYKITCIYRSVQPMSFSSGFWLLIGGTLHGNMNDLLEGSTGSYSYGTEQVVTYNYVASTRGNVRILLDDRSLENLSYSIQVQEISPISYTALNYPVLTFGSVTTGTLSEKANAILDPFSLYASGQGYSFAVQAGKTYTITCHYFAPQDLSYDTGFRLLTGNEFEGDWSDVIGSNKNSLLGTTCTVTDTYTAIDDGNMRILLVDLGFNDLMYAIEVKERIIETLPQLLGSTAHSITYSANMQFTANGVTSDLVKGNSGVYFRYNYDNYYAVAYKISLAAGNNIRIHSSKEGDSYLFIYKADGIEGYKYIARNDDGGEYGNKSDSYLNFTADTDGDYYIVLTDYDSHIAGRYFLSVWNTIEEPGNGYPADIVISQISPSSASITVSDKASVDRIRVALMSLVITGITSGNPVNVINNPYLWNIDPDRITATYKPVVAPNGYDFSAHLLPITVNIHRSSGINDAAADLTVIYAWNKNIIVRDAQVGSNLLITDMTGKIIISTVMKDSEVSIPVVDSGLYIVRVDAQTSKVICM